MEAAAMTETRIHPLAGKPAPASILVDVAGLVRAYWDHRPDPAVAAQRVAFGTSGHRGSSLTRAFNEATWTSAVATIRLSSW